MSQGATMDYGWMTLGHVELYRNSGLRNRILFFVDDVCELMYVPVSTHYGMSYGMEISVPSSETIDALDRVRDVRKAFERSYESFREKYPGYNVGLGTFRRACKYNMMQNTG